MDIKLVQKLPTYRNLSSITVFTKVSHWTQS
jgi:hypothetical protein